VEEYYNNNGILLYNKFNKHNHNVQTKTEEEVFGEKVEEKNKEKNLSLVLKPYEIKEKLDDYIIGQEEAKLVLSVAAYNHYNRIYQDFDEVKIQKSNILLIGNSGTGKTLLAETLAKTLDVPFVSIDITDFTPSGYYGKSSEDILKQLIENATDDYEKASKGIVFIDEIDKLIGTNEKDWYIKIQASLLKLVEGKEVSFYSESCFDKYHDKKINTENILFICGGAFSGIEKFLEKEKQIGFNNTRKNKNENKTNIVAKNLIEYGLMPEFVGRFPVIVCLQPLKREDLISILTLPKNALIKQYEKLFKAIGTKLTFTKDAIEKIAELTEKNNVGARGLRTITEKIINQIMFNITKCENIEECVIDENVIMNVTEPKFKYR
jgi:ATP-dependent Clp protease ATP-binding subunit ClpX